MALRKIKLGDLIELNIIKNVDNKYGEKDAIGVNIDKVILPMRGDIKNKDFSSFNLVPPRNFAYNPRGSRKMGLGFNDTENTYIITFNDYVFKIKDSAKSKIIDTYLFMYLSRKEWDRKAEFISWGSSTEVLDWKELCEEVMDLPDLATQQKYVDVYLSMIENQKAYEKGLDDLKLVCDAYIEDLRRKIPCEEIEKYIELKRDRNIDDKISEVFGVSNSLQFITASSSVDTDNLTNYKIVNYGDIAYVPTTHMKIWAVAISDKKDPFVISPIYEVFGVKDKNKLCPEYLFLWLCRNETIRYAFYNSWGSARENFVYEDLCTVKIPIPSIDIQQSIVNIYKCYCERKEINERLKNQIKDICPILIKGSIEEAKKN